MEKNINKQQERLLDLIAAKTFEELSDDERSFVVKHLSKEEYMLQHSLIAESKELYSVPEPAPLVLPEKKKGVVIPLYQAVSGVAAAILLTWLFFNGEKGVTVKAAESIELAKVDTVYIEKVITDTVVHYKTEYIDRIVEVLPEETVAQVQYGRTETSLSLSTPDLPVLSALDLESKGQSASADGSTNLVNGFLRD